MSNHEKLVKFGTKKINIGAAERPLFLPFGHFFVLHLSTARGLPKRLQFLPFPNGAGLVQLLYRSLTPPPQVFEHLVHVVHRVYLPLIALINIKNNNKVIIRLCRMNSLANLLTTSFPHFLTFCNLTVLKITLLCPFSLDTCSILINVTGAPR